MNEKEVPFSLMGAALSEKDVPMSVLAIAYAL